jgi:Raf kinase inhibitor-like YbhB/YbcL family protein
MRRYLIAGLAFSFIAASVGSAQSRLRLIGTDVHPGSKIGNIHVFKGMDCTGDNLSPALSWQGAPAATKSYAVTIYDPDAPTGSGWWHWVVFNIPASTTRLPEGAGDATKNLLPAGAVQGNTDFGAPGYGGPCPPKGDKPHHYIFTVYALNTDKIDVPANATAAYVGFNLHAHQLAKATLTGLYWR